MAGSNTPHDTPAIQHAKQGQRNYSAWPPIYNAWQAGRIQRAWVLREIGRPKTEGKFYAHAYCWETCWDMTTTY